MTRRDSSGFGYKETTREGSQEVEETSWRQRDRLNQETAAVKKQPTEQEQADSTGLERMTYPDTFFPGQTKWLPGTQNS